MPRASADKTFINFLKGKNSESSPTAVPEGTARVIQNVDIDINGTVSRRLGLDYELDFALEGDVLSSIDMQNVEVDAFPWLIADEDRNNNFYVVRIGDKLYIHDMGTEAPSANLKTSIDISVFATEIAQSPKSIIDASFGRGILLVSGEYYNPFSVSYDTDTDTFSTETLELLIRDFDGVDDGLAVDEQPPVLTDLHNYNLQNQGWSEERLNIVHYPSNAQISYLGVTINKDAESVFSVDHLNEQTFGNTPAPKGHFIIDVFNEDRLAASGIFGLGSTGTNRRPTTTAFFAGRAWYAGNRSKVYFSQILESLDKIGNCYQEQDPTAEDFNELLDTDGGVIEIPEAGQIIKLVALEAGVLVFSSNGVWKISGGVENFTANTLERIQVSDVGAIGAGTIVKVDQSVVYWSGAGVYVVAPDEASGRLVSTNLSQTTIQSDYNNIPALGKMLAKGVYDSQSRLVMWAYHNTIGNDTSSLFWRKTHVLVLNTALGAFYDYIIADAGAGVGFTPIVTSIVKAQGASQGLKIENLVDNSGENVTDNAGVNISSTVIFDGTTTLPLKVLTMVPDVDQDYQYTFSEFCSTTFHDWFTFDGAGENFDSILETAPETLGDLIRDKQGTYIFTYFNRNRGGFGSLIGTGRPDPTFAFRVSQNCVEVLRAGLPNSRVTQNLVEVLRSGTPNSRVSQNLIEVLREL